MSIKIGKEGWVNKNMKIKILYEDKDVLVIDKPAGILVHGDGRDESENIVSWFISKYPKSKNIGEDMEDQKGEVIKRSGVVHRLDKDTSGVLLLAKTKKGFNHLKEQFQNHTIKKIYYSFIYGIPKIKRGIIDKPIGRNARDFRKKTTQRDMKGEVREAITNYVVLGENKNYSFVKAIPKTGRTHQIRVHFKSIGHPIVADSLYAGKVKNGLKFKRTALHSKSIEFQNTKGQMIKVEADFPDDFTEAMKAFKDLRI
jgi:23S rRNA pseudouridine1911/1915/1917 synthase